MLVGELIKDYIRHLYDNKKKSASELERTLNNTVAPFKFADGVQMKDRRAASITSDDLRAYRDARLDHEIADAMINNELAYLRSAFYHGNERQTPKKVIEIPYFPVVSVDNARKGFVEWEGYETLLVHMPDSLKLFLVLGYHSGCRSGEIRGLDVRQVLWHQRVIELEPGTTKNNEGRYLPFYGDLEKWLLWQEEVRRRECPECTTLLFWHEADTHAFVRSLSPGAPIKSFHGMWQRAVDAAGFEDLIPHDLRRSAVRNMIQYAGIDESTAMRISGHKTNATIKRYNIVNLTSVLGAGSRLDTWISTRKERPVPIVQAAPASPALPIREEPRPTVVQMPSIKQRARGLRAEGKGIAEIAEVLGLSQSTAYGPETQIA